MRIMYDAVTAANIPAGVQIVAGYIDRIKLAPWSATDWARFPRAVKVTIVKKASTNDGHVLDVEPGDATPAEAPGWVRMRRDAGADPTVYCNFSTWPAVRAAFASAGVTPPHYWIALYDGDPAWAKGWAELGCVAKQYRGNVAPGYDLSSVADYWPGVDPANPTTPVTPALEEDDMPSFGRPAPAGTNQHVDLAVVGCTKYRIHTSFGQQVKLRALLFYGDTPAGTKDPKGVGGGMAGEFENPPVSWTIDPNRPGPIDIPAGATTSTILYDAANDFFVSASAQ